MFRLFQGQFSGGKADLLKLVVVHLFLENPNLALSYYQQEFVKKFKKHFDSQVCSVKQGSLFVYVIFCVSYFV